MKIVQQIEGIWKITSIENFNCLSNKDIDKVFIYISDEILVMFDSMECENLVFVEIKRLSPTMLIALFLF